jgi:hypothetical protein
MDETSEMIARNPNLPAWAYRVLALEPGPGSDYLHLAVTVWSDDGPCEEVKIAEADDTDDAIMALKAAVQFIAALRQPSPVG